MLLCFTNISAEILLHTLGYYFFTAHLILVHFCQMLLTLKASKIICAKATHWFGAKNVYKICGRSSICFCSSCLMKNCKIVYNSTTTTARKKNSRFGILKF